MIGVVGLGMDRERQVGGQRPRRRRPGEQLRRDRLAVPRVELEGDRQRRVLARTRGVVEPRLEMRERRLRRPGIGDDAVALVDEALVPQRFERPHDALHVGEVHGAVVVVEIDPARRAVDVVLPVLAELHHARAAVLVEARHAVFQDVAAPGELQLRLGVQLGRQAMAVPAEAALDHLAAHGLVARHQVLHEAGDDVPVMRKPVGEGRAVIEDELGRALLAPPLDRALERPLAPPTTRRSPPRAWGSSARGRRADRRSGLAVAVSFMGTLQGRKMSADGPDT